jgi:hypothetical protein
MAAGKRKNMRHLMLAVVTLVIAVLAGCASSGTSAVSGQPRTAVADASRGHVAGTGGESVTPPALAVSASSSSAALPPKTPGTPANGARLVTFVNHVHETIWVAASPDPHYPLKATGWVLRPGDRVSITVPNHWNGRFWGRTGCVFHGDTGHCQTGDCGGRFQCTGWGKIPATLAEYNLDAWDHLDFYDVSMVDGSNLPMYINIAKGATRDRISPNGCVAAGCTKAVVCPSVLTVKVDGTGVACESACARFGTDQYCCRGKWAPRAACNPRKWPVDYAAVFKRAEPYAYSYVDDDATSVFTCSGTCYYRITFGLTP